MAQIDRPRKPDRALAMIAAAIVQALIFYALLSGLGFRLPDEASETLKLLDLSEEPPPPPATAVPAPAQSTASAPAQAMPPSPVVAPRPIIPLPVPSPVAASPTPAQGPGASEGAGRAGTGPGAGSGGSGTGIAVRAQRTEGALRDRDYPPSARRVGAEGIVFVRFTVDADGRVDRCTITRSSGHAELDATTCRLIEKRFRYRPARDAQGRPVPEEIYLTYQWGLSR